MGDGKVMDEHQKINLSVVVPTIDSSKIIESNIQKLEHFLKNNKIIDKYEIIIGAQTSKDNTFEVIKQLESPTIIPLFLKKRGKGIGLTAGFRAAHYDWVLMIDDDLPYPFTSIEELLSHVGKYDIIIGSRYVQKMKHKIPLVRKVASSVYLGLVKLLVHIPQKDIQAGMKLINKKVFDHGYPKEKGYVWDTEMLSRANRKSYTIVEVPVECTHKPNKLVVYKIAPQMFMGIMRVWWRNLLK